MKRRDLFRLAGSSAIVAACGASTPATTAPPATSAAAAGRAVKATLRGGAAPVLDPPSAIAGAVTFTIHDQDTAGHAFIVVMTDLGPSALPLNGAGSMADLAAPGVREIGHSTGPVVPGADATLTLTLQAGKHVALCNLPGHYKAGEFTGFTVT